MSLQDIAVQAATQFGIPPDLFVAQINQESGFNPSAFNPASGASGIAQFIPSTASAFGIDPFDPQQSLTAAAQYDAQLYQQTGSYVTALQRYGTLPGDLSLATPSQTALANLAQSADAGVPDQGGGIGGFLKRLFSPTQPQFDPGSGGFTPPSGGFTPNKTVDKITSLLNLTLTQIVFIVLGIIFVAGAIYTYKES